MAMSQSANQNQTGGKVIFFAADIHLSPAHPRRSLRFYDFLRMTAKEGGALYLLGDIFDRWLGDDIGGKFGTEVQSKLRQLADDGVQVYVQHGNRDFLLGKQFAAAAGCKLIDDNHIISGGILLTHGDKLAADPVYEVYRKVVRSTLARAVFGILPAAARQKIANRISAKSTANRHRPQIKPAAAARLLNKHNCQTLIHGHLHNPCDERWQSGGRTYRRLCLPAWEGGHCGYIRVENGAAAMIVR